mgnify:CR=1 FL=1
MTARGGVPTPTELRNMSHGGYLPTYPLGIAERRHRNPAYHPWQRNETQQRWLVL